MYIPSVRFWSKGIFWVSLNDTTLKSTTAEVHVLTTIYSSSVRGYSLIKRLALVRTHTHTHTAFLDVFLAFLDGMNLLNFNVSLVVSAGYFLEVIVHNRLLWTTIASLVIMCVLGMTYTNTMCSNHGLQHNVLSVLLVTFPIYLKSKLRRISGVCNGRPRYEDYTMKCDSPKHRAF